MRNERILATIRTALQEAPTWALEVELARRRPGAPTGVVRLPGLVVDPGSNLIVYREVPHDVTGRVLEVLHVLATSRSQGRWRTPSRTLAHLVWRGFEIRDAQYNLSSTMAIINRRIPGLVLPSGKAHLGYGLNCSEDAAEVAA